MKKLVFCLVAALVLVAVPSMAQEGPGMTMDFKLGKGVGFTAPDKDFSVRFGGNLRLHYVMTDWDHDRAATPDTNTFALDQARFYAKGWIGKDKKWTYFLRMLAADSTSPADILDLWAKCLVWKNGTDKIFIQAGQFKSGFGRGILVSSHERLFMKPVLAERTFGVGYLPGGAVHANFNEKFNAKLGFFNNNGQDGARAKSGMAVVGRFWYDLNKPFGASECYTAQDAPMNASFGASFMYEPNSTATSSFLRWEIDAAVSCQGFTGQASYLTSDIDNDGGADAAASGWYLQGGYMFTPNDEICARVSMVSMDDAAANTGLGNPYTLLTATKGDAMEYGIGYNHYFYGHMLKIGAEINWRESDPTGTANDFEDFQFGVGMQLKF